MAARPGRRAVLFGAAGLAAGVAGTAAAAGVAGTAADETVGTGSAARASAGLDSTGANGARTLAFHGARQAGIDTPATAHIRYLGFDLVPGQDEGEGDAVRRLLRLLSSDAARLTAGTGALADTEPELASAPARLTVTFGFGPGLLDAVAPDRKPAWLRPLEAFGIDDLGAAYGQTDLLVQIGSDDLMALAHTQRMLLKDARGLAVLRWVQDGFLRSYGGGAEGVTPRNLFGQVDGTANPSGDALQRAVWGEADGTGAWLPGGTSLVLRRIRMDLDAWDRVDRPGRDLALGRRQDTGAPLTGTREHDEPDLGAADASGLPVISADSHVARARGAETILRRGYNYESAAAGADPEAGLLFASFQADIDRQFLPIQRRLAQADLLNEWATPIGSAVYAIPPGCAEGGFVGDGLFA
ncbi:Dyp-type peroxidase [Arthrobacter ginkgonis]|uniref:Dyp-type peroxidase n=1 Tax=Arthrobacter ginkgonis TaxID=1630594 RepID=A0ABP7C4F6_9MICC